MYVIDPRQLWSAKTRSQRSSDPILIALSFLSLWPHAILTRPHSFLLLPRDWPCSLTQIGPRSVLCALNWWTCAAQLVSQWLDSTLPTRLKENRSILPVTAEKSLADCNLRHIKRQRRRCLCAPNVPLSVDMDLKPNGYNFDNVQWMRSIPCENCIPSDSSRLCFCIISSRQAVRIKCWFKFLSLSTWDYDIQP